MYVPRCIAFLAISWMVANGFAQDASQESHWLQMRGTKGDGIAHQASRPPVEIDLDRQIAWETEIPGTGWSSPVYAGDLIWMTTSVLETSKASSQARNRRGSGVRIESVEMRAIAVDRRTGKLVHNILLTTVKQPEPINPLNSYASPTPAIADGKVICHFGTYGTWCLDVVSGKEIWKTQYVITHAVGPGSSPMIFDGKVVLVCDGTDQQFIVAVDLNTGKEIWKTSRPPIRNPDGDYRKSYSTPIRIQTDGVDQIVVPGAQWINGYDLATGEERWRADHGPGFSVTPMPVYDSGLVVFSTGFMRPSFVAVDPTGSGDVTESHVKWKAKGAPTMPSFVVDEGKVYSMSDKGILSCLNIATGELLNRSRIGGNFSSSPLLAGGHLYCCDRDGLMTIVRCSSDLSIAAKVKLEHGVMATPILIGDDLLIRTKKKLMRISK